jgi:hypothetical protein
MEKKDPRYVRMEEVCRPFPSMSYDKMDNNRLAVYAIALLEENGIPRTQEALTVGMFLLFPEKFSLVGFPQYPDTERANRTLLQLGGKYRNWATGDRHAGYTLTDTGHIVLDQTKKLLETPSLQVEKRATPKERTRDPMAEVKEIEASSLYANFANGDLEGTNEYGFWELLQALPYTPKRALRKRLKEMSESAKLADRGNVVEFLKWVQQRYASFLEEA